ncbi:MAG: hypothetical protein JST67_06130 [Bacteroidetes bacterium]|nr:hypothetical protein [Bacteroidota bacterium]
MTHKKNNLVEANVNLNFYVEEKKYQEEKKGAHHTWKYNGTCRRGG